MRILYQIVTGLIIALGTLHSGLTPFFYKQFTQGALWFFGAGLGLIMLGFLNVASLRQKDKAVWTLCLISNITFTAMFVAASFIIFEPQVFVGIGLCAAATVLSFLTNRI